jgi:hypothetical protein
MGKAMAKKKSGRKYKVGKLSRWGIVDVGDDTYLIAMFSRYTGNKSRLTFRAHKFNEDGVVFVEPVSQWVVIREAGERAKKIYNEVMEAIASEWKSVYELRDMEMCFDDVNEKRGSTIVYGYCA